MNKVASLLLVPLTLLLAACGNMHIQQSIEQYHLSAGDIQLGDSKDKVLAELGPSQNIMPVNDRKQSERFKQDGKLVEVYYYRIAHYMDGIVTDDEFMPYIFHDGELVGIGWQMLGGPKTQGQVQPSPTYIRGDGRF